MNLYERMRRRSLRMVPDRKSRLRRDPVLTAEISDRDYDRLQGLDRMLGLRINERGHGRWIRLEHERLDRLEPGGFTRVRGGRLPPRKRSPKLFGDERHERMHEPQ